MTLTPDDLVRARALADAATPGEWIARTEAQSGAPVVWLSNGLVVMVNRDDDATFIAASHTLVPQLLDLIEILTAERAERAELLAYSVVLAAAGAEQLTSINRDESVVYAEFKKMEAELARLRPVYEAAKAWRADRYDGRDELFGSAIDDVTRASDGNEKKP